MLLRNLFEAVVLVVAIGVGGGLAIAIVVDLSGIDPDASWLPWASGAVLGVAVVLGTNWLSRRDKARNQRSDL